MIRGTATHTKIAEAVVQRIRDLDLAGISNDAIQLRVFDQDLTRCLPGPPGVMVLTIGVEQVSQFEGENSRDLIRYPVTIVIGDACRTDIEQVPEVDRHLKWREDISQGMWHKAAELRAAGAPDEVCEIEWVPGPIFLPKQWGDLNMWVGTMQLRVSAWRTRQV